jgi:hypothetical protein
MMMMMTANRAPTATPIPTGESTTPGGSLKPDTGLELVSVLTHPLIFRDLEVKVRKSGCKESQPGNCHLL